MTPASSSDWLLEFITPVPDFPKPGILFQWYGDLLRNPHAFRRMILEFAERYRRLEVDLILGVEARGFILCSALAYEMKKPFQVIRKPGKLPGEVLSAPFEKEYGSDFLELEKCAVKPGERVLVIDDVLATGGTVAACCQLVELLGGQVVEVACMVEIKALRGIDKVPAPLFTLVSV